MKKNYKQLLTAIMAIVIYSIYFYALTKIFFINGWMVLPKDITSANIGLKFFTDFAIMMVFPIVLCTIYRKNLSELGIVKSKLSLILFGIYLIFFIMHGDFSLSGCYKAFFYICIVAAPEEIIYRGYLFSKLKPFNRLFAILISGSLWGIMHSILPGILAGTDLSIILTSMISEIGGGIFGGFILICLFEYSGSLLVPIMIHALLDYSYQSWGIIIGFSVFCYLIIPSKEKFMKRKYN